MYDTKNNMRIPSKLSLKLRLWFSHLSRARLNSVVRRREHDRFAALKGKKIEKWKCHDNVILSFVIDSCFIFVHCPSSTDSITLKNYARAAMYRVYGTCVYLFFWCTWSYRHSIGFHKFSALILPRYAFNRFGFWQCPRPDEMNSIFHVPKATHAPIDSMFKTRHVYQNIECKLIFQRLFDFNARRERDRIVSSVNRRNIFDMFLGSNVMQFGWF